MARMRLGAALLLRSPVADEVNGLRRALGDRSLDRVPAHVTLVPPINVRDVDLGSTLAVLRAAAATVVDRLSFELGPPATFLPDTPVVYLAVGTRLGELEALRARLLSPPLAREREWAWPFVPHVTVDEVDHPEAAAATLGGYRATATVDRVHLLQEVREEGRRRWIPLADAAFGPPAIVGRGGLALELTRSHLIDPEAAALLAAAGAGGPGPEDGWGPVRRVVVTGRREGAAVAVGVAWLGPDGGQVVVVVDPRHRRQGIGSHVLAAVELSVRTEQWGCTHLRAIGPGPFYAARSHFSLPST
jgi:2'-5' RNA ligase